MRPFHYPFFVLLVAWLVACSQPAVQPKELIVLDTDMGSDCDDVGALALLHQYADDGKAEILAVIYSSGAVPYGAGIVDAINTYYSRPDLPIGADHEGSFGDPVDKMVAEKLAKDTAAFGHDIIHNTDAGEQTNLSRLLLAKQADNSVTYITIGHTRGLHRLFRSEPDSISPLTGEELVTKKLKRWVALGALRADDGGDGYRKDWNFCFNGTAAYTQGLVDSLSVPTYFVDAGRDVMTGESLAQTPPGNILRTAYRDWLWNVFGQTLHDQRPSWDLATVFFAVEGLGNYLEESPPGYLAFDSLKGSKWVRGERARDHHFIKQRDGVSDSFASYLNGMIAKRPLRR